MAGRAFSKGSKTGVSAPAGPISVSADTHEHRANAGEKNGRHEETRTPDLYRVNFEVNNLKPFACLAFPQTTYFKTPRKQHIFGDELVTSFCRSTSPTRIFCKNGFGTCRGHATNAGYGLKGIVSQYETIRARRRLCSCTAWDHS